MNLSSAHLQGNLAEGDEIVEVNGRALDCTEIKRQLDCSGNLFGSSVRVMIGTENSSHLIITFPPNPSKDN